MVSRTVWLIATSGWCRLRFKKKQNGQQLFLNSTWHLGAWRISSESFHNSSHSKHKTLNENLDSLYHFTIDLVLFQHRNFLLRVLFPLDMETALHYEIEYWVYFVAIALSFTLRRTLMLRSQKIISLKPG